MRRSVCGLCSPCSRAESAAAKSCQQNITIPVQNRGRFAWELRRVGTATILLVASHKSSVHKKIDFKIICYVHTFPCIISLIVSVTDGSPFRFSKLFTDVLSSMLLLLFVDIVYYCCCDFKKNISNRNTFFAFFLLWIFLYAILTTPLFEIEANSKYTYLFINLFLFDSHAKLQMQKKTEKERDEFADLFLFFFFLANWIQIVVLFAR